MLERVGVRSDERGITSVVAVAAMIAIFGAATLTVDAGNIWQTRRNLITATDAASLAEAGDAAFSGSGSCSGTYDTVLTNNAGDDVYERACTVVQGAAPGTGYVWVEARKPAEVRFGAVLGLDDTNAYAMSGAQFGHPTAVKGLRPMAFCDQNSHVMDWRAVKSGAMSESTYDGLKGTGDVNGDGLDDYPAFGPQGSYAAFGTIHRMYFNKDIDDGACGTFPGNWGWLSFDGLPASSDDRNEWIRSGYSGSVRIRLDGEPACPGIPGSGGVEESEQGCVPGDSGSLAGHNAESLTSILHKPIYISIFDAGACTGGGVSCTYEDWAFVAVVLRGFKVTGPQDARYFDFEFTDLQVSGSCCSVAPPTEDLGLRAVKLCAVDHDPTPLATRCALD